MDELRCDCKEVQPQTKVVEAVAARGYFDGWTPIQLFGRQVAKMLEELSELARLMNIQVMDSGNYALQDFALDVNIIGRRAKVLFNDPNKWNNVSLIDTESDIFERMRHEAADMQVDLFCIAEAIERISVSTFDLIGAAVEIAEAEMTEDEIHYTEDEIRYTNDGGKIWPTQ